MILQCVYHIHLIDLGKTMSKGVMDFNSCKLCDIFAMINYGSDNTKSVIQTECSCVSCMHGFTDHDTKNINKVMNSVEI